MKRFANLQLLFSFLFFTVYVLAAGRVKAQAFTTLYTFTGGNDGGNPLDGLVQGSDGNLYGTTFNGGTNSAGTVFKVSLSGTFTSLYSFNGGNDGSNPAAGLVQGSDGDFYGTTQSGGNGTGGTVFKIGGDGVLVSLYSFANPSRSYNTSGWTPDAGLMQGNDGYFYGTTLYGGVLFNISANGGGTVFKISSLGVPAGLYNFTAGSDGANPAGALVQGSDGDFYGATQAGGISNSGTVFKTTSAPGTLNTLYSFTGGNDGGNPLGGLVQANNGYLYGTTANGGTNSAGTVFKTSPSGALTTLYSLNGGTDGANPAAGLVQGTDGCFYGTTQQGGTNGGVGTIFKIGTNGVYTSLYSFSGGNDGSNPRAALVQGHDGSFYGTTFYGGSNGAGTIFRLTVPLGPPQLGILSTGSNVILTWTKAGYTLQSTTSLPAPVWTTNLPAPIVIDGQYTVTNPISAARQFFRLSQP